MYCIHKQMVKSWKPISFTQIVVLLIGLLTGIVGSAAEPRPVAEFLRGPKGLPIVNQSFSAASDKFTFAIIGDKTGGGLDKWHIFDRAIDEINLLKPDFAIMVGDLIQGDTTDTAQLAAEWKEFWEHQSDLIVPFLALPGNHDITNRVMYDYWKENIGRTYSAFTYKNCLFLLLNTEEWHSNTGEWTTWFGEAQIDYVKSQLQGDMRHTFVLMHRPLWLQENSGWEEIEAALGERAYTVFAGHYHNLTVHTRNERRYFVLGATGGGFTPQAVPEYGAFDHYSLVTVDNEGATVAIIEPGNIYPETLSTAAFKQKVAKLLSFKAHFNLEKEQAFSKGRLEIVLDNTLEKLIEVEVVFNPSQNWQISPDQLSFQAKPGRTTKITVSCSVPSDALIPFPVYRYFTLYGGEQLQSGRKLFHPIAGEHMRVIKNWMLLGPFSLGEIKVPANANEIPQSFLTIPLPESNLEKNYQGQTGEIAWQAYRSESERVNLNEAFGAGELAYGFGRSYIKSPDARRVFAQLRWGSNLGRLYLNGVEIPGATMPSERLFSWWAHFELPLKQGWNTVTVISGDYNGWWDYRMEVADAMNVLQFSTTSTDSQD